MKRCLGIAVVASAAVTLAACSSTTTGTPTSAGLNGSAASAASSGPSRGESTPPATPAGLAERLREGRLATRSAHITLSIATDGQRITGSGVETLSGGTLSGIDLTEGVPGGGEVRVIQLGGKTYVKLPAALNPSAKPWLLVTAGSSNPTIRRIATSLQSVQSTAVDSAGVFASAAKSVSDRGPTTVDGVPARHYFVSVDVTRLPSTYPGRGVLTQAGLTTLPIDLYLDSSGRPVRLTETLTVSGTTVSTTVGATKYNQPVSITAPPANQVGNG